MAKVEINEGLTARGLFDQVNKIYDTDKKISLLQRHALKTWWPKIIQVMGLKEREGNEAGNT